MALIVALMSATILNVSTVAARDAEQRATFATPILVANASFLNVRTGPGVQFSVLVTVVGGTELPVLGVANDSVWYQVNTNAGVGWVNVEFTLPRGTFSNVPLADFEAPPAPAPGIVPGAATNPGASVGSARGRVTGIEFIGGDFRAAPSFDALMIKSALAPRPNTIYPLLDATTIDGVTWYLLNLPDVGTGWVSGANLRALECGTDNVFVVPNASTIRFDGIENRLSFTLDAGTEFYLLGEDHDQFVVELTDGTVGLVSQADAVPRSDEVTSVCTDVTPVNSGLLEGQGGGAEPVQAQPTRVTGNRIVVNTGNLNIRRGPGAQYAIAAVASGGTELAVAGVAGDLEWWLVEGSFGRGWVDNDFVLFRGASASVPVIPNAYSQPIASVGAPPPGSGGVTPIEQAPAVTGNRIVVNTGNLNVRLGPGGGFSIVAMVPGGTELAAIGVAPDEEWWLVEGSFGRGWVDNDFVLFRGSFASVPIISDAYSGGGVIAATQGNAGQGGGPLPQPGGGNVVTGRSVTGVSILGADLRAGPSYDSLMIKAALPEDRNTVLPLLNQTTDDTGQKWYLVDVPGIGRGWVGRVELRPLECGTDNVWLVPNASTIRFDGIENRDAFTLNAGTEFYLVGEDHDQFIVELTNGTVGTVAKADAVPRPDEVVSICDNVQSIAPAPAPAALGDTVGQGGAVAPAPVASGNRVVVNTGNLNIRSGPSAGFSVVATVPGGTELATVGRTADGAWYLVEVPGVGRGWLSAEFVVFRGAYASVPIINF